MGVVINPRVRGRTEVVLSFHEGRGCDDSRQKFNGRQCQPFAQSWPGSLEPWRSRHTLSISQVLSFLIETS